MKKWEYQLINDVYAGRNYAQETTAYLNRLGEEGWELVCVREGYLVFKRPNH